MKLKFYYNESKPTYTEYNELIEKMKKMTNQFYKLDYLFYSPYNYEKMKNYEKKKLEIINQMFEVIISYFPSLSTTSCAIYLNGSYARGNITSGSDIDLTLYFNEKDISKYQSTIYLIRYAIANMLNVNIVHVHSFTKNFITDYRKENNLIINDSTLKTKIIWTKTNEILKITYPKNQMIAERETCEINSIKNFDLLKELYENQLKRLHPKEWIYTHKNIHITDKYFDISKLIKELDNKYINEQNNIALDNIKKEINDLIKLTNKYYNSLNKTERLELANFNMIGKRKVTMLIHAFATYLRWYYISNNLSNIPITLKLDDLFEYKTDLIDKETITIIRKSYCYFRYLISKIEIWARKYNHHFEHRSKEIIKKSKFTREYKEIWNNNYSPINEQIKTYRNLITNIEYILKHLK